MSINTLHPILFSKNDSLIIIIDRIGKVFCFKSDTLPNLISPAIQIRKPNKLFVSWAQNSKYIYVCGDNELYFGNPMGKIDEGIKMDSDINDFILLEDKNKLIVFEENSIESLEKNLYLLNFIPIKEYEWPIPSFEQTNYINSKEFILSR